MRKRADSLPAIRTRNRWEVQSTQATRPVDFERKNRMARFLAFFLESILNSHNQTSRVQDHASAR